MKSVCLFIPIFYLGFFVSFSSQAHESADLTVATTDSADLTESTATVVDGANSQMPALIPTGYFADMPAFSNARLSPDGKKLSFFRRSNAENQIVILDIDTGATLRTFFLPQGFDARYYRWLNDERMLIHATGVIETERYYYRVGKLFVASALEGTVRSLIPNPFLSSYADIVHVFEGGTHALISHPHHPKASGPSVYRYRLDADEEPIFVQPMIENVSSWTADEHGIVRLGIGRNKNRVEAWYRSPGSSEFILVGEYKDDSGDEVFEPVHINAGSDIGLALDEGVDGRVGLHRFDFAQAMSIGVEHEVQGWDIDEVWFEDGRALAAVYTDDARTIDWLDPEFATLQDDVKKSIANRHVQLWVQSRSRDDQRMLIWIGDEADPGVLYLLDRKTMAMRELGQFRPSIDFTQLARPQPISYTSRDGLEIRGYLTLPVGRDASSLPLIIMPHGGPFGVRDSLRYDDWVQMLANRGYAVLQPNYRGSGGYGEAFYNLGVGEVGRRMQDDLDDAVGWAVDQGIADARRVCIVGGSYGGYAAIWAVIRNPERYRCAASWAGVTDWARMLRYDRKYLTSRTQKRWRKQIEGDADFNMKDVSPVQQARTLRRPVLLGHGSRDRNVPFSQFERMVKAGEKAPVEPTAVAVHGEGHSFSDKRYKIQWLNALDAFLARHNPADQVDENGDLAVPVDQRLKGFFKPLIVSKPDNSQQAQE